MSCLENNASAGFHVSYQTAFLIFKRNSSVIKLIIFTPFSITHTVTFKIKLKKIDGLKGYKYIYLKLKKTRDCKLQHGDLIKSPEIL